MKVYIVHELDYTHAEIRGVFYREEDAERSAAKLKAAREKDRAERDLPRGTMGWVVEEREVQETD